MARRPPRPRGLSIADALAAIGAATRDSARSTRAGAARSVSSANRDDANRRAAPTMSRVRSAGRAASSSGSSASSGASSTVSRANRPGPRPGSTDANARNAAQAIALAIRNSPTGAAKPRRGTFREKVAQETNRGIVQGDRSADRVDKKDLAFAVEKFMQTHKWAREAGKDSQAVKDAAAFLVNKGHKQYRRK